MTLDEFKFKLFIMGWEDENFHGQFYPPVSRDDPFAPPGFVELYEGKSALLHIRTNTRNNGKAWKKFHNYASAIKYLLKCLQHKQINVRE